MRKNDLIKKLQEIEGNPEILLWNGYVGDWQHIDSKFVDASLVKMKEGEYIGRCRLEECFRRKDWQFQFTTEEIDRLKSSYKRYIDWEDNGFVTSEDIELGRYKQKKVVFIKPKARGEKTWGRCGTVEY